MSLFFFCFASHMGPGARALRPVSNSIASYAWRKHIKCLCELSIKQTLYMKQAMMSISEDIIFEYKVTSLDTPIRFPYKNLFFFIKLYGWALCLLHFRFPQRAFVLSFKNSYCLNIMVKLYVYT